MTWLNKLFQLREHRDGEVIKPFLEHMEDLRWTLIKMISSLGSGMMLAFFFRKPLFAIMIEPLKVVSAKPTDILIMTGVADSILISLTLAFYAGILLTFPLLLFFLLEFVLPALTRQEKKYVMPGIAVGFVLFLAGVSACYYLVLPQTLHWLHGDAESLGVKPQWMVRDYFSFVTRLCIGFGLLGELPAIMTVLAALGFVSHAWLIKTRLYAIVIILALAAFIAPTPDPMTFLMLGLPIILLYESCIWIVWLMERRRSKRAASGSEFPD
ncbi:MAG: sec-independent protein translocase protein TatC [Chthoniobacter sp.]|jgi:sec-independent protein translocase protein TatC|nr:sec-independent protein translocase protein TatC [Chthoniobacter sp.]